LRHYRDLKMEVDEAEEEVEAATSHLSA
jgi:hypothetical protein